MMDESFTHSLYIGRDKALEVARRRQAVERELKEKREAKIREQNERVIRAQQQKEAELRERIRQRQEKELLKQKAVLDRRCHQLEKDRFKMKEILNRVHSSASRPAQAKQKKVYVFGSSTPRELSYLETKRFYNPAAQPLNASAERLSTSPLANGGSCAARLPLPSSHARTPSRIVVGGFSATPKSRKNTGNGGGMMTRSVYATLGGGGPARKLPVSGGNRSRNESSTNSSTNESGGGTSSVGGGSLHAKPVSTGGRASAVTQRKSPPKQQPSMTQSLYEPLPSKRSSSRATPAANRNAATSPNAAPAAAAVKPPTQRTFNNGTKVTKAPVVNKTSSTRAASAVGRNDPQKKNGGETEASSEGAARPPPIRPRKAVEKPLTVEQKAEDSSQTVEKNQEVVGRPAEKNGDESVQNTTDGATAVVSPPSIAIVTCGDDLVNDATAEDESVESPNCVDAIASKLAAVSLDTAAADVQEEVKRSSSATTDPQLIDLTSIGSENNVSSSVMEWMNRNEASSIPDDDGNKEVSPHLPLLDGDNTVNRASWEDGAVVVAAVTPVVEAVSGLANGGEGGGGSRDEWDSGHESNSAVEIDAAQQLSSLDKDCPLSTPKALSVDEAVAVVAEEKRIESAEKRRLADAHEAAEREREARRQKLNEILKRTRVNGEAFANGNGDVNSTTRKPSVTAAMTNIDATALAQELLAQRRQMKMQSLAAAAATTTTTANGNGTGSVNAPLTATSIIMGRNGNNGGGVTAVTPLGDELASAGFFTSSMEPQQNVTVVSSFRSEPNRFLVTNGVGNCDASNTIGRLPGEVLSVDGRADMVKKQPPTSPVDMAATSTTTSTSSNGTFIQESEPVTASM